MLNVIILGLNFFDQDLYAHMHSYVRQCQPHMHARLHRTMHTCINPHARTMDTHTHTCMDACTHARNLAYMHVCGTHMLKMCVHSQTHIAWHMFHSEGQPGYEANYDHNDDYV